MTRFTMALAVAVLGSVLAAGCGGSGEQQNRNTGNAPAAAAQAPATATPPTGNVDVTLTSQPDPPKAGETTFEAMVMQDGRPLTDADVSVELFMAAMPAMKMPEMKSSVPLKHEGGGHYRGTGTLMMAGNWEATVRVKGGGQEIGTRKVVIAAK